MAKLSELKSLLDKAKLSPSPRGVPGAKTRAAPPPVDAADVDLSQAFADVQPLRPGDRAAIRRAQPASVASQRLPGAGAALAGGQDGGEAPPPSPGGRPG